MRQIAIHGSGAFLALLLACACADPTALLVQVDAVGSQPEIRIPDSLDALRVIVESDGVEVAQQGFELTGREGSLRESFTVRPGETGVHEVSIRVWGMLDGLALSSGEAQAAFAEGQVKNVAVHLDWLPDACQDQDQDGYGIGRGCKGADCDDGQALVNPGASESCNAVDDDCDGATDEAEDLVSPRCALFMGVCREALKACVDGQWQDCQASDYGPDYRIEELDCTSTIAPDGFDNDCDGAVDEGCPCQEGHTRPCQGLDTGTCDPGEQPCEWIDNDWRWGAGCQNAVMPRDEQCDAADDDCDGQTDEDFDFQTDLEHCGDCATVCDQDHSESTCENAACVLHCEPDWHDVNGILDDGCEYPCHRAEPPEERCNGIDDDCDGATDEDAAPPVCQRTEGVCAQATRACLGVNGWGACDYGPDYEPQESRCDGLDNDCDGLTDLADPGLIPAPCERTLGECAGDYHFLIQCTALGWQTCTGDQYGFAFEEDESTCDDKDNDCDGLTDETTDCSGGKECIEGGCACPGPLTDCYGTCVDTSSDAAHCNGCGQACDPNFRCENSACVPDCPAGWMGYVDDQEKGHCITPVQTAATCCQAIDVCDGLGAEVGFPQHDLGVSDDSPPSFGSVVPGVILRSASRSNDVEVGCYYQCYEAVDAYGFGHGFSCTTSDCGAACPGCTPGECDFNTCDSCGCANPFWCTFQLP